MPKLIKSNIWKMYAFSFFSSMHFFAGVLIPFFTDWGGLSFPQITYLQSWYAVCVLLFEIPTGAIADFFGRKMSLILAMLANIVALIFYTTIPNFYLFMIAEALWALAMALVSGTCSAIVYDSLKEIGREKESKKFLGKLANFNMAGLMMGSPFGGVIASSFGLNYAVLFMVVPLVFALLIAISLKEPRVYSEKKAKKYSEMLMSGIKYFSSHKILIAMSLNSMVIRFFIFSLMWSYQVFLKKLGVDLGYFGFVHFLICAVQIIVIANLGKLEKIVGGKSRYLFFSAFVAGLIYVALGFTGNIFVAVAGMIFILGLGMPRKVIIGNYMQKHIESHNRATVMSVSNMFSCLLSFAFYPIFGWLIEWSLEGTFILFGFLILAASLILKIDESYLID